MNESSPGEHGVGILMQRAGWGTPPEAGYIAGSPASAPKEIPTMTVELTGPVFGVTDVARPLTP